MKENRATFLKRLAGMSANDIFKIMLAYDIAKEGHGYLLQTRDTGERYFEHPRAVAIIVIDELGIKDPDVICAILLHDICEDTHIWGVPGRIAWVFGERVALIVDQLTKPPKDDFDSKAELLDFYFVQMTDRGAIIGKIGDRLHNLRSIDPDNAKWDASRIDRYRTETKERIMPKIDELHGTEFSHLVDTSKLLLTQELAKLPQPMTL
jgi:(p)ppGpp synthase/HD superfamily hydrolase